MTDWDGRQIITGFARDILDRLPRDAVAGAAPADWGSKDAQLNAYWRQRLGSFRDTVTWSPVIDPEWLKLESLRLLGESGVRPVLHALGAMPIMQDGRVRGVMFESKEGRAAIFARAVVDATGDGDIFARAAAEFHTDVDEKSMHHSINVAWLWAGVDMHTWITFRTQQPDEFAAIMDRGRQALGEVDRPYVSWRNDVALFLGPRLTGYSAINVEDLTTVEIESRRWMVDLLEFYRANMPGFADAWVLETAPQIGVRHSRRLTGVQPVVREDWQSGMVYADEIGVSPSLSPAFPSVSVPYGSLVPANLDGLLAPGRHVASDAVSHTFLREIPQCWLTGQAAGVGAALAANAGVQPREVEVGRLQEELLNQGAFLRRPIGAELKTTATR
jgi:hypothetical protein